jgi:cytochrome c oxidase subunit 2
MNTTHLRYTIGVTATLLVGVVTAWIILPSGNVDSTTEGLIRSLNRQLVYIAVPISLLVEVVLLYTVLRFRNNTAVKPTQERQQLEIAWTVATALVLLFVGVASYQVMAHPAVTSAPQEVTERPANATEVTVIGQRYAWTFEYPGENVTSYGTLVLPANRTVYLDITSRDVIHSVHVPGLGLKQDAMPGRSVSLRTTPTGQGTYQLYCAEYCGVGHSKMTATVKVVSYEEYQQWLNERRGGQ